MNYQLNAIKTKSNRSLASRIATGSVDAGDITVAYRTLSYLFDAFLVSCIYNVLYYAIDRVRWILRSKLGLIHLKLGPIRMKLGLTRMKSGLLLMKSGPLHMKLGPLRKRSFR